MNKDLKFQIALTFCKGLGHVYNKQLILSLASAENVWKEKLSTIHELTKIPKKNLQNIGQNELLDLAEKEIEICLKKKIKITSFFDDDYPRLLKQCDDAPLILYHKGNIDFSSKINVAIVGSRKMTNYGAQFIQDLITDLEGAPITIVSGLAYGCDIQAHRMAIDFGLPTWAVLAHHLDKIYPAAHKKDVEKMMDLGGIISEYNSINTVLPENFLQRNRIIAGLSQVTILVESSYSGGALVTAKFANDYNREVLALPGKISDEMSKGNNHLIKTHQAYLIENAKDLMYHLDLSFDEKKSTVQTSLFVDLSAEEQQLVEIIKHQNKIHIDDLAHQSNQFTYQLLPILLELELKQIVKPLPGKFFELY